MMLAAGGPSASTLFFGRTTSEDGAAPKVQVIMAPMETWLGMSRHSATQSPPPSARQPTTVPFASAVSQCHCQLAPSKVPNT